MIELSKPCIQLEDFVCFRSLPFLNPALPAGGEPDFTRATLVGRVFGSNMVDAGEMVWYAKTHGFFDEKSGSYVGTRKMLEKSYSHSDNCKHACVKNGIDPALLSSMCSVCARAGYVNNSREMAERVIVNALYRKDGSAEIEKILTTDFKKRLKARKVFFEKDFEYGTRLVAVTFDLLYDELIKSLLLLSGTNALSGKPEIDAVTVTDMVISGNKDCAHGISDSARAKIRKELLGTVLETLTLQVGTEDIANAVSVISSAPKGTIYTKRDFAKRFSDLSVTKQAKAEKNAKKAADMEQERCTLFDDPEELLEALPEKPDTVEAREPEPLLPREPESETDTITYTDILPSPEVGMPESRSGKKAHAKKKKAKTEETACQGKEGTDLLSFNEAGAPVLTADISKNHIHVLEPFEISDFVLSVYNNFFIHMEDCVLNGNGGFLIYSPANAGTLFFLPHGMVIGDPLTLILSESNVSIITFCSLPVFSRANANKAKVTRSVYSLRPALAAIVAGGTLYDFAEMEKQTGIKAPSSSSEFLEYFKRYSFIKGLLDAKLIEHGSYCSFESFRFYEELLASSVQSSSVLDCAPAGFADCVNLKDAYLSPKFSYQPGDNIRGYGTILRVDYRLPKEQEAPGVLFGSELMRGLLVRKAGFLQMARHTDLPSGNRQLRLSETRFVLLALSDTSVSFYVRAGGIEWFRFMKEHLVVLASRVCKMLDLGPCDVDCEIVKTRGCV